MSFINLATVVPIWVGGFADFTSTAFSGIGGTISSKIELFRILPFVCCTTLLNDESILRSDYYSM